MEELDKNLLDKFFRNECSAEEVEQVKKWFNSIHYRVQLDKELKKDWEELMSKSSSRKDLSPILEQIQVKINQTKDKTPYLDEEPYPAPRNPLRTHLVSKRKKISIRVVVSLSFVLLFSSYIYLIYSKSLRKEQETVSYITKDAPYGAKLKLQLSDGSRVILNSGSKIIYPKVFNNSIRELTLEGEAFFEVAKDSKRPFIVRSGIMRTVALGTSFNVNAFPGSNRVEVALVTGKVKVWDHKDDELSVILKPGEKASYDSKSRDLKKHRYDLMADLAWKEGILYFKDESFETIKTKLEKWYGVKILVENSPQEEWMFTGTFKNESLDNVLEAISFAKTFEYEKLGKTIKLTFKNDKKQKYKLKK